MNEGTPNVRTGNTLKNCRRLMKHAFSRLCVCFSMHCNVNREVRLSRLLGFCPNELGEVNMRAFLTSFYCW